MDREVEVTAGDMATLFAGNPVAMWQARAIALERRFVSAEGEVERLLGEITVVGALVTPANSITVLGQAVARLCEIARGGAVGSPAGPVAVPGANGTRAERRRVERGLK